LRNSQIGLTQAFLKFRASGRQWLGELLCGVGIANSGLLLAYQQAYTTYPAPTNPSNSTRATPSLCPAVASHIT